jgi:hypothetical protein
VRPRSLRIWAISAWVGVEQFVDGGDDVGRGFAQ